MHVLTKIFAVLVSLLAVLLVPLVVVYAYNEDSYKAKFESASAQAQVARAELSADQTLHAAERTRLETRVTELDREKSEVQRQLDNSEANVRRLETELAGVREIDAAIKADIARLAVAAQSGNELITNLVAEVKDLRSTAIASERQKVELDDALRNALIQLEVADQARRALAEELARVKEELADARGQIGDAIAQGFDPTRDVSTGDFSGIAPDRNLTATVINVRRSADETLAEIDAGQTDGVKMGWIMTLGRGSAFKGKLRIIAVDVNRATGIVTLEDPVTGRVVEIGDDAVARVGEV